MLYLTFCRIGVIARRINLCHICSCLHNLYMRPSLIKVLCLPQVFACGPDNRVNVGDSLKVNTHPGLTVTAVEHLHPGLTVTAVEHLHPGLTVNAVEHLPVASEWPRIGGQRRCTNTCSDCGAFFMDKLELIVHVKSEHGRNRFSCPCCECTFVSKGGLKEHIQYIHQKVARYQCETCGKGYANRTNFVDHLTTHTGVKRNVCSVCRQRYTFKCSLKSHMLRCHPSESGQAIPK